MDKFLAGFMKFIIFIAGLLALSLLMGWFTAWMVNYTFGPALLAFVFGGKVGYMKGVAINFLSSTLIKSGSSSSK